MTKSLSQFEHTQIITPNEYETNEKMISRTIYEKKNASNSSGSNTILISPNLMGNFKEKPEGEYLKEKELKEISEEDFEDLRKNIIFDKKLESKKKKKLD
jgi:hypothetical protein